MTFYPVYHGTLSHTWEGSVHQFRTHSVVNNWLRGAWFTDNIDYIGVIGRRLLPYVFRVTLNNPLDMRRWGTRLYPTKYGDYSFVPEGLNIPDRWRGYYDMYALVYPNLRTIQSRGYDGVILHEREYGIEQSTTFVVFDSSQIEVAERLTDLV